MAYRYLIHNKDNYLAHAGKKGMKWGYNDGKRNGKREATELEELDKLKNNGKKSEDFQGDYNEANNMLKYLGISLDLQSDNNAAVETMKVYEEMRDSKDKYKNQYDWLSTLSKKLTGLGYDMTACDKYLSENKDKLNTLKVGSGSNNREDPYKDNEKKEKKTKESKKKKSSSKSSSNSSSNSSSKTTVSNKTESKKSTETTTAKRTKDKGYTPMYNYKKYKESLSHTGIPGMKWGIRRFQNPDGTLTEEGKRRYGKFGVASTKTNTPKKYSKKIAGKMTDAELEAAANRLEKEKRYKSASKDNTLRSTTDTLQTAAIATTAILTLAMNSEKILKIAKRGREFIKGVLE